jgi:hypothetical protein
MRQYQHRERKSRRSAAIVSAGASVIGLLQAAWSPRRSRLQEP